MQYIYLLKNEVTKRGYVGRSYRPDYRYMQHINSLKAKRHTNEQMQRDFEDYGEKSFSMEIVESAETFTGKGIEGKWILKMKSFDRRYGYNYKDPFVVTRTGKPTSKVAMVYLSALRDKEIADSGKQLQEGVT